MDWFNLGSLVVILWIVLAYCLPDWKKVVWPKLEKEKAFQHLVFATLFFSASYGQLKQA